MSHQHRVNTTTADVNADDAIINFAQVKHTRALEKDVREYIAEHAIKLEDAMRAYGEDVDLTGVEDLTAAIVAIAELPNMDQLSAAVACRLGRPCFCDDYVYVESKKEVYNLRSKNFIPLSTLTQSCSKKMRAVFGTHLDDGDTMTAAALWNSRPNRKICHDIGWRPVPYGTPNPWLVKGANGQDLLNTWPGFKPEPKQGTVRPWLDLVAHLTNGNKDHAEYLISRIAFDIQFPHLKCNVGVMIAGIEGAGKDALLAPIAKIFGKAMGQVSSKALKDKYDDEWCEKKVIQLNETQNIRGDAIEMLKSRVASDAIGEHVLNIKSNGKVTMEGVWSVYCTTNHIDALKLTPNDRRWFVLDANVVLPSEQAIHYFDEWVRKDGPAFLFDYLLKYDLSKFDPAKHPPKTEAFFKAVNAAFGKTADSVKDIIEQQDRKTLVADYIRPQDIIAELANRAPNQPEPAKKYVVNALIEIGYAELKEPIMKKDGITKRLSSRSWYAKTTNDLFKRRAGGTEIYKAIEAAYKAAGLALEQAPDKKE